MAKNTSLFRLTEEALAFVLETAGLVRLLSRNSRDYVASRIS